MRQVSAPCFALVLATASAVRAAPAEPAPPVSASTRQLLVVKAAHWNASSGQLERYERDEASAWHGVGAPVSVSLGRNGLAWGRGRHPSGEVGPTKHEGDGRSPAGVYGLSTAFGAAEALPEGAHAFPYRKATPNTYCVEDVRSPHYNELIEARRAGATVWQRWSPLLRADGLFRWGVVVSQNGPDVVVGAGSCVFLHLWRGSHLPTSGCTAMAADALEAILRWLDPKEGPLLVQLPAPVYRAVAAGWGLPEEDVAAAAAP